jgi:Phage integrase, N-terminal SAM-like domain
MTTLEPGSPLRQRMLEDMQLRGLSARTQAAYTRAVWQLAKHYHLSPAQLSGVHSFRSAMFIVARP